MGEERDGLSREGNLRSGVKLKCQKTRYSKLMPMTATSVPMDFPMGQEASARQQVIHEVAESKSASLKDLCPEDKRRIANLIKELARVSEEKEVTEERLKAEQESFEKKIRQLEEQNELIVTEREALQQQYRECQELLSLYQRYLSEQQEKLKQSVSDLNMLSSKQQVSHKKSPQQPKSLEHDGSYLDLPRPETLYKGSRVSFPETAISFSTSHHYCRSDPATRMTLQSSNNEGLNSLQVENGFLRKCNNILPSSKLIEPHSLHMTHDINSPMGKYQNIHLCCMCRQPGSAQHVQNRSQVDPLPSNCSASFPQPDECIRPSELSLLDDKVKTMPQEMSPAKELNKEQKNKLLLQKMELEIEKERLQQLLAQQETKLLRKQQQLRQSMLDYNRSQPALDSEALTGDEAPAQQTGVIPVMNGTSSGQRTPTSSKNFKSQQESNGSGRKVVCFSTDSEEDVMWMHNKNEISTTKKGSRKDAATSPAMGGTRKEVVTTATSPIQANSSRYESSFLEQVEARTPISALKHLSYCRDPSDWSNRTRTQQSGNHRPPARQPIASDSRKPEPDDELEEDRILGEIFFIC
ncbi:protein hinderin isoform X2 [Rhinatrema bivittatum]|uniref:protein hinderin isoform X2 n=1 Tax=Rhinatrema bivittatum TaxID=194408 RepID=UPI00112D31EC|nr:protein hinderin isoform X2 [Rhinatrema bivittatum]